MYTRAVCGCIAAGLLYGCALTPYECETVGVAVSGAPTGRIIAEYSGTIEEVSARCYSPFKPRRGCAIPVHDHDYIIWHDNTAEARDHERCHALYETKEHKG